MGQNFYLEQVSPGSATDPLLWVLLRLLCLLTQIIAHGNASVNDLQRIAGGCPQFCAFSLLTGRGARAAEKRSPFPPASGVPAWDSTPGAPAPAPASLHTALALRVGLLCEGQFLNAQASATSGRPV